MRKLLNMSDHNFLFWGAENGFPDKSLEIVLYSIAPLDQYIGQMRPFIDATSAAGQ
jgi:hypothetical protein